MTIYEAHPASQVGHRGPGIDRIRYGRELASHPGADDAWAVFHNGRKVKLFFLLGHPRSGTNWLGKLVNLHPRLHSEGEFRFECLRIGFDVFVGQQHHVGYHEPGRSEAERCFQDSVRRIMASSDARSGGAEWIGDRTPRALDFYLPGAPTLLIIRDPRDVITSWAHLEIGQGHPHYQAYSSVLEPVHLAFNKDRQFFKKHPEKLFEEECWMRHLARFCASHSYHDLQVLEDIEDGLIDASVHVVRYEFLEVDPEGERAKVYEYFGVDPAEAAPLSEDGMTKPGFSNERPGEMYRKGRSGDWTPYFTPKAKQWFKEATGDLLIKLGYESDNNW